LPILDFRLRRARQCTPIDPDKSTIENPKSKIENVEMASLTIQNLTKAFNRTSVVDDVSFEVPDGEFCVLLGPSGCGKTTLLRVVAGLETASSGKILIANREVDSVPPGERDIAFVFQNYALYPHLTVFDNLAFSLRLRRVPKDEMHNRVLEAAQLLEIDGYLNQKPQQLSGGQRQRVAVGRAIVRRPKVFLFDEPLSNLDATLRANTRLELARLHQKLRSTVLYVTHDQTEAMTLGEKIVILNHGRIQQIGSPSAIYHQPINTFVAGFVGNPQMNLLEGALEQNGGVFYSGSFRMDISEALGNRGAAYVGRPIAIGIRPEDIQPTDRANAPIVGKVELIEDLGADQLVHLSCGGIELVARVSPHLPVRRGEILHLNVEPKHLHLFDQDRRVNFAEQ
jgi:multiple sugar transport system ATP-binding protein